MNILVKQRLMADDASTTKLANQNAVFDFGIVVFLLVNF